jgi:proteasome lid subunit RPN8/RPN11
MAENGGMGGAYLERRSRFCPKGLRKEEGGNEEGGRNEEGELEVEDAGAEEYTWIMAGVVRIRKAILERMAEEARRTPAQECCGLLAGRDGLITEIFPATNALASATEFEIAPEELFRIFRAMREAGLEHLGIYHSHPRGPEGPSARDVEQANYPEAAYFVLSPVGVRAFEIREGKVEDLELKAE